MGPEQAPTRAAVLELKAERVVVEEAYDFLDEKRLLLAAELLAQLARYEQLTGELQALNHKAGQQLADALKRHGLEGLGVYPAPAVTHNLEQQEHNLMGVLLVDTRLTGSDDPAAAGPPPSNPSREAQRCAQTFARLAELSARLAGVSGNVHRLFLEYRITERRARALENVILPDIENGLKRMSAYLEELDLEEAIRARPTGGGH